MFLVYQLNNIAIYVPAIIWSTARWDQIWLWMDIEISDRNDVWVYCHHQTITTAEVSQHT